MQQYDTTQPRISVRPAPSDNIDEMFDELNREFELGQGNTWGEATFWMRLGYTAVVSTWNGRCYTQQQMFTEADL